VAIDWDAIFDNYGSKVVTATDKRKAAYVPTRAQLTAIRRAGIKPSERRPADEFEITVLGKTLRKVVNASFYHSLRETDPFRSPEPRMGHEFISKWLREGDRVVIGNIGKRLFATKERDLQTTEEVIRDVTRRADASTVMARARAAVGKPAKRAVIRQDFERNPWVVAGALLRAKGECEMPRCTRTLFPMEDGQPYLEVHHVLPLGEGGDDSLVNAAALCPHCHRELHFGKNRMRLRRTLEAYVVSLHED